MLDRWTKYNKTFTVVQASPQHRRVEVESRGHIYACSWAADTGDPALSREAVEAAWQQDRPSFRPFDQSTGQYC